MSTISEIFNAYININILLILVFGFWYIARMLLKPMGMAHAYTTQLRLLNGVFLAVVISPVFILFFSLLSKYSVVSPEFTLNLSDIIVAQYLNGNFNMKPDTLEEYLSLRSQLSANFLGMGSYLGIFILGLIISGAVLVLARFALSVYALKRIINQSQVWRKTGNLHLLISDTISVPFSTRTFRERFIIIPSNMLTNIKDLRMVVSHEFQHMRQLDLEWEIFMELLRPVFFWNPIYYLWKRQLEQLRELSCDKRVLARKRYDTKEYCACLLQVCQNSLSKSHLLFTAIPKVALIKTDRALFSRNSASLLRQRVNSLLDGNIKPYPKLVFLGIIIPLLAIVVVSTLAIQQPDDWSQDRIMLSTIINLDRLAEHNSMETNF